MWTISLNWSSDVLILLKCFLPSRTRDGGEEHRRRRREPATQDPSVSKPTVERSRRFRLVTFFNGLVRKRPLQPIWTIVEPWGEGDESEWVKLDVNRVADLDCRRCHHRHHAACVALQPGRDHQCRRTARRPPHARLSTTTRPELTWAWQRIRDRMSGGYRRFW